MGDAMSDERLATPTATEIITASHCFPGWPEMADAVARLLARHRLIVLARADTEIDRLRTENAALRADLDAQHNECQDQLAQQHYDFMQQIERLEKRRV